jgi:hypothetical protein
MLSFEVHAQPENNFSPTYSVGDVREQRGKQDLYAFLWM